MKVIINIDGQALSVEVTGLSTLFNQFHKKFTIRAKK